MFLLVADMRVVRPALKSAARPHDTDEGHACSAADQGLPITTICPAG
jgi:hypothetical protein